MIRVHEPHCPVPRAARRGEGAVCLCRDGSAQRVELALQATAPERIGALHDKWAAGQLTECQIVPLLLSELARVHELLSGAGYFDYDRQKWVDPIEKGGA